MTRTHEESITYIDNASTTSLSSFLKKTVVKLTKTISHISFIRTFISFKLTQRARMENWLTHKCLDSEHRIWFCNEAKQQDLLRRSAHRLSDLLNPNDFLQLRDTVSTSQAYYNSYH